MGRRWRKLITPLGLLLVVGGLFVAMRLTALERDRLSLLEKSLRDVLVPAEQALTLAVNKSQGWLAAVRDYGRLRAENQSLKEEIAALKAASIQLEEYRQENARLRSLLNYTQANHQSFDFTVAPVIARNPSNWYHTLTLGLGARDGLQKNQVVVTSQG
ncbi:MAG: rod shape-determining protein MreC, partial [Moorella sp. (in: Bacteria)]|nr:rod shape-determining protein MreC [Moorella sp. (in: firmicutes)]